MPSLNILISDLNNKSVAELQELSNEFKTVKEHLVGSTKPYTILLNTVLSEIEKLIKSKDQNRKYEFSASSRKLPSKDTSLNISTINISGSTEPSPKYETTLADITLLQLIELTAKEALMKEKSKSFTFGSNVLGSLLSNRLIVSELLNDYQGNLEWIEASRNYIPTSFINGLTRAITDAKSSDKDQGTVSEVNTVAKDNMPRVDRSQFFSNAHNITKTLKRFETQILNINNGQSNEQQEYLLGTAVSKPNARTNFSPVDKNIDLKNAQTTKDGGVYVLLKYDIYQKNTVASFFQLKCYNQIKDFSLMESDKGVFKQIELDENFSPLDENSEIKPTYVMYSYRPIDWSEKSIKKMEDLIENLPNAVDEVFKNTKSYG